jgi:hypothetical protein
MTGGPDYKRIAWLVLLTTLTISTRTAQGQTAVARSTSREVLVTVTGSSTPLVALGLDDFAVDQGGQQREVLSVRMADYPIAILIDDASIDLDAIKEAAARFIGRIGQRPVSIATFSRPQDAVASYDDDRATVLTRLKAVRRGAGAALPLEGAAQAAQAIHETGAPFSSIVLLAGRPFATSEAGAANLAPLFNNRSVVYVVAKAATAPEPGAQDDALRALAEQTGGQSLAIFSPLSYAIALDRIADRLATEMTIEFLVPAGTSGGDVRVGVRIPGAVATGRGVSRN